MPTSTLNPDGFFEFDLGKGAVHAREGRRVLILSDDVVAPLVAAAVGNKDLTAVRRLGQQLGESAAAGQGDDLSESPADAVLSRAAGVLSLFGWGRLEMERWGHALVARLDGLPVLDEEHLGIAALLGGLFSALADREVACVPVSHQGYFLLVDPSVAQKIWKWSRNGDDVAAIVGRLAIPTPGAEPTTDAEGAQ